MVHFIHKYFNAEIIATTSLYVGPCWNKLLFFYLTNTFLCR